MRRLAMLALLGLVSGCGAEPATSTVDSTTGSVTATESAAIDEELGLAPAVSAAEAASEVVVLNAEDMTLDSEADWARLEAELAAMPPIRTGPMASVPSAGGPNDSELAAERQMQLNLPRADHPLWTTLRQTRISIDERTQLFRAVHPGPVRVLAGSRVTVRGYMLPLEASDRTRHFLVSPYTPVCFFHPPAEPNEVIEVKLSRPIDAGYHLVEVSGVLKLADNGEKGLFFVIDNGTGRVVERIE